MLEKESELIPIFKDLLSIKSVSTNLVAIDEIKEALDSKLQFKIVIYVRDDELSDDIMSHYDYVNITENSKIWWTPQKDNEYYQCITSKRLIAESTITPTEDDIPNYTSTTQCKRMKRNPKEDHYLQNIFN